MDTIKYYLKNNFVYILLAIGIIAYNLINNSPETFFEYNISKLPPTSDQILDLGYVIVENTVAVGDPAYINERDEGYIPINHVIPGKYPVKVYIRDLGNDKRISWASLIVADSDHDRQEIVGDIPVDSGTAAFTDLENYMQNQVDVGPERIGFLQKSYEKSPEILNFFELDYTEHEFQYEIKQPVSIELELKILNKIKEITPEEKYPGMVLYIETGNTWERLVDILDENYESTYQYANMNLATDNNIIVFSSGYGDGSYPVIVSYKEDKVVRIDINMLLD